MLSLITSSLAAPLPRSRSRLPRLPRKPSSSLDPPKFRVEEITVTVDEKTEQTYTELQGTPPPKLRKKLCCLVLIFSFVMIVNSRPQGFEGRDSHATERKDDVGRVQIKVYRGPTKHDGYAPWGFWVKQPSDEEEHN